MDPQQEFFTELRARLKTAYPGKVYDTRLPKSNTPYPFIYLGGSGQRDSATKSVMLGYAAQSVRVWHSAERYRQCLRALSRRHAPSHRPRIISGGSKYRCRTSPTTRPSVLRSSWVFWKSPHTFHQFVKGESHEKDESSAFHSPDSHRG